MKDFIRGESFTIAFQLNVTPIDLRAQFGTLLKVSLKEGTLPKEVELYVWRLSSEDTMCLSAGSQKLSVIIETVEYGIKKLPITSINVIDYPDSFSSDTVNRVYDVLIPINITSEMATVGTVLYDMLRGENAYQLAVDEGYTGTQAEWLESLKGDAFEYSDFTPEQLEALKVKGDTGIQGIQGVKGDKGDKGDAFIYSDFTPEQLLGLKGEQGEQGIQGIQGEKGDKGDTGLQGIQGVKGDKGDKGDPLTYADLTEANKADLTQPIYDDLLSLIYAGL